MKPNPLEPGTPPACAERMGRALGRIWRGVLRRERKAGEWLTAKGLPPGIAQALPLLVKLAVLGVALYAAFWAALVLMGIVVVAWGWWNAEPDWTREEPEWREGHSGFGLYDKNEWRYDMGDPEES